MIRVKGGSPPEIVRIRLRDGASLGDIQQIYARGADNVTRVVWSAAATMNVTAEPASVEGAAARPQPTTITTSQSTARVSGGAEPYSYLWSIEEPGGWSITAPNSPTTAFRAIGVAAGEAVAASFVCTVTDRFGSEAISNNVTATATNYGDLTGGPIP